MHDKTVMLHFFAETLPFVIFAAIAIFAVADKGSPRRGPEMANVPRPRRFSGYVEGEGLVMTDPDGKLVTRSR
jgi:hypothetical protein